MMQQEITLRNIGVDIILMDMKKSICADPFGAELVRQYYDKAVESKKFDDATNFFEKLLDQHPRQNQMRTLLISLYLQKCEYPMALNAIEALLNYSTPDDELIDRALSVRNKVGPLVIKKNTNANPTICVCMIVRDEQSFLGPCLHAIKPIADEIVVVDTGSIDRSADIATVFGAQVYHFVWRDDFSAARNYGLKRANADWILIMDADETIAAPDQMQLRKLVAKHHRPSTAYSIETRNYTHASNTLNWQANLNKYPQHETGLGWFPSRKIRLFPNLPEIGFRYPVHELVDNSVREVGLTVEDCEFPIHHYGHLDDRKNNRKAKHYFKMGYDKLHQLKDNVAALRELAIQAGELEFWSESLELWRRLLSINNDFIEAHVNISGANWQLGNYDEALEASRKALTLNCEYKEAEYNCAVSLLLLGRAQEAADMLDKLCQREPNYLGAQFMHAVSLVCAGEIQRGNVRLNRLSKTMKSEVLVVALQELIKRMHKSDKATYAEKLDKRLASLDVG